MSLAEPSWLAKAHLSRNVATPANKIWHTLVISRSTSAPTNRPARTDAHQQPKGRPPISSRPSPQEDGLGGELSKSPLGPSLSNSASSAAHVLAHSRARTTQIGSREGFRDKAGRVAACIPRTCACDLKEYLDDHQGPPMDATMDYETAGMVRPTASTKCS